jgi:hypothetical protein
MFRDLFPMAPPSLYIGFCSTRECVLLMYNVGLGFFGFAQFFSRQTLILSICWSMGFSLPHPIEEVFLGTMAMWRCYPARHKRTHLSVFVRTDTASETLAQWPDINGPCLSILVHADTRGTKP